MAQKRNHIAKAILILVVALAIAGICRTFCVEFYRVAPAQMENTLLAGDRICVDKLCYGIRLPQTISLLPFTDTIPFTSLPAYYPTRPLPYKRIKTKTAQRGDIVIYNYPTEQNIPISKSPTAISRCIGIPGDTIVYETGQLRVNGQNMAQSPYVTDAYQVADSILPALRNAMQKAVGKEPEIIRLMNTNLLYIDRYAYDKIKTLWPGYLALHPITLPQDNYRIELPPYGKPASITPHNAALYAHIINRYEKQKVILRGNKLYRGGREVKEYTFSQPYYWVVGDNRTTTIDSRYFGALPHSHLIGRCRYIIYSIAPDGASNNPWRSNRFMLKTTP